MDANWRREAIVEILRQRGKVRAKELAERFQVTRQTIYHDVEVLSLHYDLCTETGRNGGIYLLNPKRHRREYLSYTQVEVLQQILESLTDERKEIVQSVLDDFRDSLQLKGEHTHENGERIAGRQNRSGDDHPWL